MEEKLEELRNKYLGKETEPLSEKEIKEAIKFEIKEQKENKGENYSFPNQYIKYTKDGFKFILIDELANDIMEEHDFKTIFNSKGEDIWFFDMETGLWEQTGKQMIKTLVEEKLREHCKINPVNEVLEKVKRKTAVSKNYFNKSPEELICLNNGVFNVKTKELLPFDAKYNFKNKLEVDYDPAKDCPVIKNFIEDTFYPEDIPVLQEWIGFHLYRRYFIKKAMILFGEPDTGKTVFLNLLIRFINDNNVAGISLHDISRGDKFSLAFLKDKLANIYDDLSSRDLVDQGGFKMATGGSKITAEHKFGDDFQFQTFAKNTFATNKIPEVTEKTDDAYYERWLPIACDNQVPKEEQDKFIIDKLTAKDELSGLFNWALEGLDRLLKNSMFSYNRSNEETKNIMEKHSNGLAAFCQDCLVEQKEGSITREEMYILYTNYSKLNKLKFLSKEQIGRQIMKHANYIIDKREKERFWGNIGINVDFLHKMENLRSSIPKEDKDYDTLDTLFLTLFFIESNNSSKLYNITIDSRYGNFESVVSVVDGSYNNIKGQQHLDIQEEKGE